MKKKLVILSMGMLPVMVINAQQQDTTLVRTVVVENQYNPIVMDASKINVLPKVEEYYYKVSRPRFQKIINK